MRRASGKDRPGSPLTDAVHFPKHGIAWEFNYRGNLVFLAQANAARARDSLQVEDGWFYFIHGWTGSSPRCLKPRFPYLARNSNG